MPEIPDLFVRYADEGWLALHFGMTGKPRYYENGAHPESITKDDGRDVYGFFNNTAGNGHAPHDVKRLRALLGGG